MLGAFVGLWSNDVPAFRVMADNHSKSKAAKEVTDQLKKVIPGDRWTYLGGVMALSIALAVNFLGGNIYSSAKAREMIEALSSSALYFGAAIATSSATILALMLTLVGMTRDSEHDFSDTLYQRVMRICIFSTITLCSAILLLLMLSLPVGEFQNIHANWYPTYYWILVTLVSALTGLTITVVLMLFNAIRNVITTLTPAFDNDEA